MVIQNKAGRLFGTIPCHYMSLQAYRLTENNYLAFEARFQSIAFHLLCMHAEALRNFIHNGEFSMGKMFAT